jgi:hypothetical protein
MIIVVYMRSSDDEKIKNKKLEHMMNFRGQIDMSIASRAGWPDRSACIISNPQMLLM